MAELHGRFMTSSEFARESPVLQLKELGLETDTGRYKVGDGKTRWNQLEYPFTTDGASTPTEPTPTEPAIPAGDVSQFQVLTQAEYDALEGNPPEDDETTVYMIPKTV